MRRQFYLITKPPLEGTKAESTLEPPSGFELETFGLLIKHS